MEVTKTHPCVSLLDGDKKMFKSVDTLHIQHKHMSKSFYLTRALTWTVCSSFHILSGFIKTASAPFTFRKCEKHFIVHQRHIRFVIRVDSLKQQVVAMCWDETTPDYILLAPVPVKIYYYITTYNDYRGKEKYNNSWSYTIMSKRRKY